MSNFFLFSFLNVTITPAGSVLSSLIRLACLPFWSYASVEDHEQRQDESWQHGRIHLSLYWCELALSGMTQPVRSSSLFLALLFVSPFYLPPLLFQTIHWRAEVKQIITSTDWWPKPGNRITVTIDPAVNLFFTAKGARTRLFLLLAGKAQCYPSSFLCWLLPLILILLSVSVQ